MTTIFDPIRIGDIDCPNRIFMSPLTRARSTRDHIPTPLMAEYYTQRAGAGLIISEATSVSAQGLGTAFAPGIWNEVQVAAWQPITRAVHAAGGRILCQLWHMGRVVHPDYQDGAQPVSASAVRAPGEARTNDGMKPYVEPRALGVGEIATIVDDFAKAARNAITAGFDGIQLHAANGYLIDQFLRNSSNHRTDAYGGTPEKQTRLLREITEAVVTAIGPERTAVRVSPAIPMLGCEDSAPGPVFLGVAEMLDKIGIAFLEVRQPAPNSRPADTGRPADALLLAGPMRARFRGPMVLNTAYNRTDAMAAVAEGLADAITFGKAYIANPDLKRRLAENLPLNLPNPATFYGPGPQGYIDYPRHP